MVDQDTSATIDYATTDVAEMAIQDTLTAISSASTDMTAKDTPDAAAVISFASTQAGHTRRYRRRKHRDGRSRHIHCRTRLHFKNPLTNKERSEHAERFTKPFI